MGSIHKRLRRSSNYESDEVDPSVGSNYSNSNDSESHDLDPSEKEEYQNFNENSDCDDDADDSDDDNDSENSGESYASNSDHSEASEGDSPKGEDSDAASDSDKSELSGNSNDSAGSKGSDAESDSGKSESSKLSRISESSVVSNYSGFQQREESDEPDEYCFEFWRQIAQNPDKYLKLVVSGSNAQNKLISKIKDIGSEGSFAVSGTCYEYRALTNPGLYVQDKLWSLPLTNVPECPALEDAPFGKGPNTVLDHKVRKSLQVKPSDVQFKNPDYEIDIQKLAKTAARDLGLADYETVEARLHKLLIYRKGDHFAEHIDAVHQEGMFGTLIVQLPGVFTGGKLTVSHAGLRKDFLVEDQFQSTWMAFYGDCLHKVRPLKSGIRAVLTYDLVRTTPGTELKIPKSIDVSLKKEVKAWLKDKEADKMLFIVCEHLYPRSVLGNVRKKETAKRDFETIINILKGADQARARALYSDVASIGLVAVRLGFEYIDQKERECCGVSLHVDDLCYEDNNTCKSKIKRTQIFAPNKFKNTPIKYLTSTECFHVGNDYQPGTLELTYSAIVLMRNVAKSSRVSTNVPA